MGRLVKPAHRRDITFAPWVNAAAFTMEPDDTNDGTMPRVEDSLQCKGLEHMDICLIQDIDMPTRGKAPSRVFHQATDGCYDVQEHMRSQGVLKAIGVGAKVRQMWFEPQTPRDFDCFLRAGRTSLLERDALNDVLPLCKARGAAVVGGGGFSGAQRR